MPPLYERDLAAVASVLHLRFYPLATTKGEGAWLVEEGGRRLLDMTAAFGAAGLGYAHPAVVEAVRRAAGEMAGVSALFGASPEVVGFAEELLALLPGGTDRKVYIGHAGSDANTAAIRAARAGTGRSRVLSFGGSYHGGLGESQGVSGVYVAGGLRPEPGLAQVPYPHPYASVLLPDVLDQVDRELSAGDVAMVIVEPVTNDGGVIVPPDGFLKGLRERCDRYGTLLCADEVKVGLGRTGTLHAFEREGIVPDVLTLGKTLGGGLPLSAAVLPAEVDAAAEGAILLTTIGNAVCAAAGRAVLSTIASERLWTRAEVLGDRLLTGLRALAGKHPLIGDVRGRGLTIGVELVRDRETKAPAKLETALTVYRAFELGVLTDYVGPGSNVIELTPPLILTEEEVDLAVEVIDAALSDVEAGKVPESVIGPYKGW
ncbi:aspartate aminotransferase family protein [Phytohabitans aurantiacus]|uniref:Aspartate aminotransferase family protein n=1 Tax=Phytohabitans aurantiacus TaxID=3016789 RepID=A0ABQ5R522_9ACTN|nr:aspartate aminotransferase family protein [Phytohabitans aurantiacus]GLI01800.1 aspartate aminotransferase family protein [Phytohabitans aurantiacus]